MTQSKFLQRISDIGAITQSGLEQILGQDDIAQVNDSLFFNYRYGMNRGLRPVVVDEQGRFWIGKEYSETDLVFETHGSNLSNFLGVPSPSIDCAEIDGKKYILSEFLFSVHYVEDGEMPAKGQAVLVPRLLTSKFRVKNEFYVVDVEDCNLHFGKVVLDTDFNRANFLVDPNGTIHQIDFSLSYNVNCCEIYRGIDYVQRSVKRYGISADPNTATISEQLKKLSGHNSSELVDYFTKNMASLHQKSLNRYRQNFVWAYNNIQNLLGLIMAPEEPRARTIVLSGS